MRPATPSNLKSAKVKAVLDIYVLRKQPHFMGEKVSIGAQ